jgi:hypothetical protein
MIYLPYAFRAFLVYKMICEQPILGIFQRELEEWGFIKFHFVIAVSASVRSVNKSSAQVNERARGTRESRLRARQFTVNLIQEQMEKLRYVALLEGLWIRGVTKKRQIQYQLTLVQCIHTFFVVRHVLEYPNQIQDKRLLYRLHEVTTRRTQRHILFIGSVEHNRVQDLLKTG